MVTPSCSNGPWYKFSVALEHNFTLDVEDAVSQRSSDLEQSLLSWYVEEIPVCRGAGDGLDLRNQVLSVNVIPYVIPKDLEEKKHNKELVLKSLILEWKGRLIYRNNNNAIL